jgi:hypothetical protein
MSDDHRATNPLAHLRDARRKAGGRSVRQEMQLEPLNEHEATEFAAASRNLGHRRLGRWMNDRLLRRLAGVQRC